MSEQKAEYSAGRQNTTARAIAEKAIIYRPSLKKMTGSTNGSILLQQIMYRWYANGEKPFYKFLQPCEHDLYREGDSWSEEIGFSYSELQTALDKFATKITRGESKTKAEKESAVIYWTDADRITWWQFNPDTFDLLYNSEKSNYLESDNPRNTLIGINTETTTKSKPRSSKLPAGSDPAFMMAAGMTSSDIAAANEQANAEKELLDLYESEMGYGVLDWYGKDLERLRKFLVKQTAQAIRDFAAWSKRPYSTFDPPKARLKPDLVPDMWPQAVKQEREQPQEENNGYL